MSYTELARQIIDKNVKEEPDTVNIVFEKVVNKNTNPNFEKIKHFLNMLNIKVNARFLMESNYEELKNFQKASLNLLAFDDYSGQTLKDFFTKEYNSKFFDLPFPIGYDESIKWLTKLAKYFNKEALAQKIIDEEVIKYQQRIQKLKPILKGKKLMVVTYNHEIDWLLKTALDLDMEIVKVGILNYSQDVGFRTRLDHEFNVEENYENDQRDKDVLKYQPDIFLSNYASAEQLNVKVTDTIPMCPDVGFDAALGMATKWATLIQSNQAGEWKNDKILFNKYYSR